MPLDVIDLTHTLCRIPSVTGEEAAVANAVESVLKELGLTPRRQSLGHGRDNVLAIPDRPRVVLTTHIDTVPPYLPPHEDGEWIVGRGVIDAKGIAASMIVALERLLKDGISDVGVLFVVGEETDSDGARAAVQGFLPKVDFLVDGEPTELKLCTGMKGVLVFDLECTGKAGHSAYAESGHSAVHQLLADCQRLLAHPWPDDPFFGPTTLNIGTFDGGVAPNVWAPSAKARCIMRTTRDADELERAIRSLLSPTTTMTVRSKNGPQRLHSVDGEATTIVAFGSDVPYLRAAGTPLLFGPGSILDAHTPHERVKKQDLVRAVDTYARISRALVDESKASEAAQPR